MKSESTMGLRLLRRLTSVAAIKRGYHLGQAPGFPVWPCRFTSKAEENNLAVKRPSAKIDQVAVVFLGKYLEK